MQTVIYKFADGSISKVEVSDELFKEIEKLDKAEKNNERAETRRHVSIQELAEKCIEPPVEDRHDFGMLFADIHDEALSEAIRRLKKSERDLLYKVYYEREKLKDVAKAEKVSKAAITLRLQAVLARLRTNR